MEEELEPFVRHGTEEQRIEVLADEVLNAIAEGHDIDIEYAIIKGDLDIGKIAGKLEKNQKGRPVIKGDVRIDHSELLGNTCFFFGGGMSFESTVFRGKVHFVLPSFRGFCKYVFERYLTAFQTLSKTSKQMWYRAPRQLKHGFIEPVALLILSICDFLRLMYALETLFRLAVYAICSIFRRFRLGRLRNGLIRLRLRVIDEGRVYVEICLLVSLFMLGLPHVLQRDGVLAVYSHPLVIGILCWRMMGLLLASSGTIFLSRYDVGWVPPASINRSFIMLMVNFAEIIFLFSILYLSSHSIAMKMDGVERYLMSPCESLYFSIVTITTVGYGDFRPVSGYGRSIVALQVLIGFYFVVLIFSSFLQMFSRNSLISAWAKKDRP